MREVSIDSNDDASSSFLNASYTLFLIWNIRQMYEHIIDVTWWRNIFDRTKTTETQSVSKRKSSFSYRFVFNNVLVQKLTNNILAV